MFSFSSLFSQSALQVSQPGFLSSAVSEKLATTIDEVGREARETLWLKSILNLDHSQLGLDSAQEANRFKAIMVLLFHEQMKCNHSWEQAKSDLSTKQIRQLITHAGFYVAKAFLFDHPLKRLMQDRHLLDNDERFKRFEEIFDGMCRDLFGNLLVSQDIENGLFMESDRVDLKGMLFDPMFGCLRQTLMILCDVQPPLVQAAIEGPNEAKSDMDENRLTVIDSLEPRRRNSKENELNRLLEEVTKIGQNCMIQMNSIKVVAQAARFNFEAIRKVPDLAAPEHIAAIRKIAKEKNFGQMSDMLGVQHKYIAAHLEFLALYERTCKVIQEQYLGFSEKNFQNSYTNAFSIFISQQDTPIWMLNYIHELHLMQARYPRFQMDLLALIDTYAEIMKISLTDITDLVKNEKNPVLFLQDILIWARSAWKTGASPFPENDAKIDRPLVSNARSDAAVVLSHAASGLTLFSGGRDASHSFTVSRTEMLVACPEWLEQYRADLKKHKEAIGNSKSAVQLFFGEQIDKVDSLPQLAALSFLLRKESPRTWLSSQGDFGKKGTVIMQASLRSDNLLAQEKIDLIDAWKDHPFFKNFFVQRHMERAKARLSEAASSMIGPTGNLAVK